MDFVFDWTSKGRSIKNLTVVDDATHEAVAIATEDSMGGSQLLPSMDSISHYALLTHGE